jgi:hypothetical protein
MDGHILDYSGDLTTSMTDITTSEAAMMMMYIKSYYIGNPLPRFEYMRMLLSRFPE